MTEPPSAADLSLLDPDGSFARRLAEDRASLARLAGTLAGASLPKAQRPESADLAAIELIAHRLAGAAGTFGHAAVSSAALDLEGHVIALRRGAAGREVAACALDALLTALDQATGAQR